MVWFRKCLYVLIMFLVGLVCFIWLLWIYIVLLYVWVSLRLWVISSSWNLFGVEGLAVSSWLVMICWCWLFSREVGLLVIIRDGLVVSIEYIVSCCVCFEDRDR